MKVVKVNLGNGLYRLEIVPTMCCENVDNVPTRVKDSIVNDFISRENGNWSKPCVEKPWSNTISRPTKNIRTSAPSLEPKKRSYADLDMLKRCGEPDGIDIHVDRPLREKFASHSDWAMAMAKYRTLEDVAKDCDWECREPMKGTPFYKGIPSQEPCECPICDWFDDEKEDTNFGMHWFEDEEDWCPCRFW